MDFLWAYVFASFLNINKNKDGFILPVGKSCLEEIQNFTESVRRVERKIII